MPQFILKPESTSTKIERETRENTQHTSTEIWQKPGRPKKQFNLSSEELFNIIAGDLISNEISKINDQIVDQAIPGKRQRPDSILDSLIWAVKKIVYYALINLNSNDDFKSTNDETIIQVYLKTFNKFKNMLAELQLLNIEEFREFESGELASFYSLYCPSSKILLLTS